jgi:hypothetical protein
MGPHDLQPVDRRPLRRHETVVDAQLELPDDRHCVRAKVVVVDAHAAKHRVFDGHHRTAHRVLLDGLEDILERSGRMHLGGIEDAADGFLAEGTGLSLKGNVRGHRRV